ncbi:Zn-dependent hydrolase [Caenimonas soli]|uniref:Zn-dependent hydrolase n=1 Tax=Caenimonas soli TaxID=2735555 RepID=UPI0015574470|nr:Zn-dependent hydrolase [Caenimonas soli]NPC58530.1 Zn-dependent hydrolase [Caenimonas soli]
MSADPQTLIDAQRLWRRVETLSAFTLADQPWTRRAFTPEFQKSRDWLRGQMEQAGLAVRLDAAGNLIGRREGRHSNLPPLMTGSHCDTVVSGGRFDGIIGVLAGIAVAQALEESGAVLDHPLEVVDFLSEEPSDYGISCIGSRGMTGVLTSDMLAATNPQGETLSQGMERIGASPAKLQPALRGAGDVAAFVELHIEQGPVLEKAGLPIGVVSNIVGIRRVLFSVVGQPDHAGTTPMDIRRDALVGAAGLIERANAMAAAQSGKPHYVVATIGRIAVTPNAPNAVPGLVEMMLEVRSDARQVLDHFPEELLTSVQSRLEQLRVSASFKPVSRAEPTDCSPVVMDAVRDAATALDYPNQVLPSGAGHDAAYMAACGPMGMIFIPCLNGRSHCPEEWIEPGQLADGARVLHRTLTLLDRRLSESRL